MVVDNFILLHQDLSKVPWLDGLLDSQDDYDLIAKIDQLLVETQNIKGIDDIENNDIEDSKIWWDSDSQNILNPQQLLKGFPLLDDFFQSQTLKRDGEHNEQPNLFVSHHLFPMFSIIFPLH